MRDGEERVRASIRAGNLTPAEFRAALLRVPKEHRDTWVNHLFGIEEVLEDGPSLPAGCAPYLPCSVDAILRAIDDAEIDESDVFVDIGCGVGRPGLLVRLLTGASVVGIEIQPALVAAARGCAQRLGISGFAVVEGDGAELAGGITGGSVFFLYCPFGRERLVRVLDGLEPLASARTLRICAIDLPLPRRSWLSRVTGEVADLVVYRSSTALASPHNGPVGRSNTG